MSIFSTLHPLLDPFWWILTYFVTPVQKQTTFTDLNDDCILHILEYLTAPQLLSLRAVSRRLSYLTERYRLPQYRTLLYGLSSVEASGRGNQVDSATWPISLYMSTRTYAYSQFSKQLTIGPNDHSLFYSRPRQVTSVKLNTFPPSLPSLLPRLASLTGTHFLVGQGGTPTEAQVQVPAHPQPDTVFFENLNQLSVLRHLYLEFYQFFAQEPSSSPLLPDNMPVLSGLVSFTLENYGGLNVATLIAQLGPHLSFLSLYNITCTTEEFTAFLASKPSYGQTLKNLEVCLRRNISWQLITTTVQSLHSLDCFFVTYSPRKMSLVSYFTHLARLTHLREISYVPIYHYQLYALGSHYLEFGSLPRVSASRVALAILIDDDTEEDTFDAAEFYDELLPLLAIVFSRLEHLCIYLRHGDESEYSEHLSVQLLTRTAEIFKGVRSCIATYNCPP